MGADAPTKVFSEEQFNAQYGGNAKADMDPFTGVETYSMRYAPKKNTLPKLSDAPFDKNLFPEELWYPRVLRQESLPRRTLGYPRRQVRHRGQETYRSSY